MTFRWCHPRAPKRRRRRGARGQHTMRTSAWGPWEPHGQHSRREAGATAEGCGGCALGLTAGPTAAEAACAARWPGMGWGLGSCRRFLPCAQIEDRVAGGAGHTTRQSRRADGEVCCAREGRRWDGKSARAGMLWGVKGSEDMSLIAALPAGVLSRRQGATNPHRSVRTGVVGLRYGSACASCFRNLDAWMRSRGWDMSWGMGGGRAAGP